MSRRSAHHTTATRGKRLRERGFTLIELTVSLVAGLIVAMGIMTLSREATRTFNEEARGSAAEATLRSAIDRLRGDLGRAAYMSTGNIMSDPMIAKAPGTTNVAQTGPNVKGILHLASINLTTGGSVTNGIALSSAQTPALAPDSFDIAGNMTSAEQFEVQMIVPSTSNCTQIMLSSASSAMYRIAASGMGTPGAAQELRNAFQPVPATMTTQFMVRLVDTTGHTQYLATCPGANAAGFTGTQPWVSVSTADTPIQYAVQTHTQGGVTGYCVGCIVNPVQIVRWEITTATKEQTNQAQYATALDSLPANASTSPTIDPNKYDLMRTYVDATWTPIYATSELVAEYAVDLKLAFSVDNTILGDQKPSIVTFAFDDTADNKLWGTDVSTVVPPVPNRGPERIRSARVRLVTRAAQADRTVNVPVSNFGVQEFMYRYCVNAVPSCATNDQTLRWARARTVTAEVALPNPSQDFY
jgi:prepilin-type N-terminal cleavage/methylation domain-containing protein